MGERQQLGGQLVSRQWVVAENLQRWVEHQGVRDRRRLVCQLVACEFNQSFVKYEGRWCLARTERNGRMYRSPVGANLDTAVRELAAEFGEDAIERAAAEVNCFLQQRSRRHTAQRKHSWQREVRPVPTVEIS